MSAVAPGRTRTRPKAVPPVAEVRFRSAIREARQASADQIVITGTPIVYDQPYVVTDIFGEFTERMNPSVGADAVSRRFDVRLLVNDTGLPLARTSSGTLDLEHGAGGLDMTARVDGRSQQARDLLIAIERGDVREMSVGFIVEHDQWNDDWSEREIFRFREMLDVSVVTFPASPTTSVQVAQRMVDRLTPESMARVRRLLAVKRAGKVLSDENQGKIADAAKSLHAVLIASGFDPADLLDGDDPDTEDGSDESTEGSGNGAGTGMDNADGSGAMRSDDLAARLRAGDLFARLQDTPA